MMVNGATVRAVGKRITEAPVISGKNLVPAFGAGRESGDTSWYLPSIGSLSFISKRRLYSGNISSAVTEAITATGGASVFSALRKSFKDVSSPSASISTFPSIAHPAGKIVFPASRETKGRNPDALDDSEDVILSAFSVFVPK